MKSLTKDTNHFLRIIETFGQLSEGPILCAIGVVGLYPKDKELVFTLRIKILRIEKKVLTETLIELVEIFLKNNIFHFNEKNF